MTRAEAASRAALALAFAATLAGCPRRLPEADMPDAHALPPRSEASAKPAEPAPPRRDEARISPYDPLNDVVLTGRIKAALLSDPQLAGSDISVNTDRGVVALTGTVRTQEQVAIASALAQREDGVMRIDNHLSAYPE